MGVLLGRRQLVGDRLYLEDVEEEKKINRKELNLQH